jgi:acetyl-CoA carboxylase biotin carboxylase subunit
VTEPAPRRAVRTVLVANRGEIALRVVRACRDLGLRVVAVYSTADADSPVVAAADQAVCIGPTAARRSYLNSAAIIEAALRSGADAVHPGYGFLSEDPDFAEACAQADLTFVGPPADVIAQLGDKAAARALMTKVGVPTLAGSGETVEEVEEASRLADELGYPVIVKAVAGGGGKGMRVVSDQSGLARAYLATRAAAQQFFGDSRVYLERFLTVARHVEVQILRDHDGNAVYLGERDCSVQRRHQKLIEETPAPRLPAGLTERMGEAAVRGADAAGYVGAATFEFLVDENDNYYFIEVNCRIQVEHPVTEVVTGVDLVAEQLRVAAGEPLSVRQADIAPRGAAIECRINVEDPSRDFMPTPGRLDQFEPPAGPWVRVDTSGRPGMSVSPAYDSLLAKVVTWGRDRTEALARMRRALGEFRISGSGVHTTRDFLADLIETPQFRAARHDTNLVGDLVATWRPPAAQDAESPASMVGRARES